MSRTTRLLGVAGAATVAAVLTLAGTAGADGTATPDGTRVTVSPDGTRVTVSPDGTRVTAAPDGTRVTSDPDGSRSGTDQSLHVASGRPELPLRVFSVSCAPAKSPRQFTRPHRATEPASCTGDV